MHRPGLIQTGYQPELPAFDSSEQMLKACNHAVSPRPRTGLAEATRRGDGAARHPRWDETRAAACGLEQRKKSLRGSDTFLRYPPRGYNVLKGLMFVDGRRISETLAAPSRASVLRRTQVGSGPRECEGRPTSSDPAGQGESALHWLQARIAGTYIL